jgi:hypothetical protein
MRATFIPGETEGAEICRLALAFGHRIGFSPLGRRGNRLQNRLRLINF